MYKYLISFCFLLINFVSVAQKTEQVHLISSARTLLTKDAAGQDFVKVFTGTFQHDNSTLQSDSAYFYPQKNAFDAFGHVVIHQGDTLNIYSDLLNYNGNTHIAILTNNVRMVDKDAVLTTDHLTYNTLTKYGTYTDGGKLTQNENTLTSRNGYYFAFSRDAYFRYNVVLTGKDLLVKSDTMRYNSDSKIAYFYGPTHIYQKTDTLYTENGTYNTTTRQAFGTKNNRYQQNTKTLVGDTLYFDDIAGYGRANHHIIFNDTQQKTMLHGDLANYYQKQERVVVTKNAYVTFITEQRDSVNRDSLHHPQKYIRKKTANPKASATSTASSQKNTVKTASGSKKLDQTLVDETRPPLVKDTVMIRTDSIYMSADTLESQVITYKIEKERQAQARLAGMRDTSIKAKPKRKPKGKNDLEAMQLNLHNLPADTTYRHLEFFGKVTLPKPQKKKFVDTVALKKARLDSIQTVMENDPVYKSHKIILSDTAHVRIIKAWHNAKIYKSDLQAVSDSIFFSNSDSLVRCYQNPIIWTQGSQLSGDTIFLQLKNKKLDNMDLISHSFIVNTQGDSTYFNQITGKKIRGIFSNNKLSTLYVDGNAESNYFDYQNHQFTGMNHSLSSRIRIRLINNQPSEIVFISKADNQYSPIKAVTEEQKILKGFLWKPKERPLSKDDIIYSTDRKSKKTSPPPKTKTLPEVKTAAPDLAERAATKP